MNVSTGPEQVDGPGRRRAEPARRRDQIADQAPASDVRVDAGPVDQPRTPARVIAQNPPRRAEVEQGLDGHDHGRHRSGRDDHHDVTRGRPGRLVRRPRPPRPAVAGDPRPLAGPRLRGDAPADPGAAGRRRRGPSSSAGSPRPTAMAAAGPGAVITAWGRLGYPRRARRLWEAAVVIAERRLARRPHRAARRRPLHRGARSSPRPTTRDVPAVEVNIRRVVERVRRAARCPTAEAEAAMVKLGAPLRGRDRLLALMDVGALLCRPRARAATSARCGAGARPAGALAGRARSRPAPRSRARSASAAGWCWRAARAEPPSRSTSSTPRRSRRWSPTASPSCAARAPRLP